MLGSEESMTPETVLPTVAFISLQVGVCSSDLYSLSNRADFQGHIKSERGSHTDSLIGELRYAKACFIDRQVVRPRRDVYEEVPARLICCCRSRRVRPGIG